MADLLTDAGRVATLIQERGLEPLLGALITESGEQDRAAMLATLENATDRQLDALNQLYRASLVGKSATLRASAWAIYADLTAALRLEYLVARLDRLLRRAPRLHAWMGRRR